MKDKTVDEQIKWYEDMAHQEFNMGHENAAEDFWAKAKALRNCKTTADGYPLNAGDQIWVRSNVIDPKEEPSVAVVGEILEKKLLYDKPNGNGFVGASLTAVFHKKENAYWSE